MNDPKIHRQVARHLVAAVVALAAAGCATQPREPKAPACPGMPLTCELIDKNTDSLARIAAAYLDELGDHCTSGACGGGVKPTKAPTPRHDLKPFELDGLVLTLLRNPELWQATQKQMTAIEAGAR